mmetsp:Transcript_23776/g.45261  ORF Transcript_23776/g.45261 Transcript_23776/m.45261 type:complete len:100 (-) Transcript_23776:101-400(-)
MNVNSLCKVMITMWVKNNKIEDFANMNYDDLDLDQTTQTKWMKRKSPRSKRNHPIPKAALLQKAKSTKKAPKVKKEPTALPEYLESSGLVEMGVGADAS